MKIKNYQKIRILFWCYNMGKITGKSYKIFKVLIYWYTKIKVFVGMIKFKRAIKKTTEAMDNLRLEMLFAAEAMRELGISINTIKAEKYIKRW